MFRRKIDQAFKLIAKETTGSPWVIYKENREEK